MYPYLRMALILLRARRDPQKGPLGTAVTHHRAWPWDTDMYGELNNGRILTLFELGRWSLAVEIGLLQAMRRRKAGFAVAGVSVRYRRRVPLGAKYRIETRPLGWDEKFFYLEQQMWMGDVAANQVLLRSAFVTRNGTIAPPDFARELGHDGPSPALPDWVTAWIEAEGTRPWPPALVEE
ncbi:MAG: acyl-CoA thioesterase [Pseudomonadota bacterium]